MREKTIIILLGVLLPFYSFCQSAGQPEATNVHYTSEGNQMVITFDLPEISAKERYEVSLILVDSITYKKIYPKAVSGDFGKGVSGGKGKKITWNFSADKIGIPSKMSLQVNARVKKILGGPSNALLSVVVPGLGDYFVSDSKIGFLYTVAAYGLVGYGLYEHSQSNTNYTLYHSGTEQGAIDASYDLANSQNKTAGICIATGAAVWAADVIWVAYKGMRNNKIKKRQTALLENHPSIRFGFGPPVFIGDKAITYSNLQLTLKF